MKERKTFWDRNAGRYDRFMRKDRAAYDEMYVLIRPVVKAKTVLELATGTGLIAKHIVNAAAHICLLYTSHLLQIEKPANAGSKQKIRRCFSDDHPNGNGCDPLCRGAVSYTHLDVYKRQIPGLAK